MKNVFTKTTLGTALFLSVPLFASAFLDDTKGLIEDGGEVVNTLLWVASTAAVLVFIWGIVKYIKNAGDAKAAGEGKSIMIYGAIALFVLFSVFGIITFIRTELFGEGQGADSTFKSPRIDLTP